MTVTQMEARAIAASRILFYHALVEAGLHEPFHALSPEQVDQILWAVVNGFRASMQRQSMSGEVPF